MHVVFSSLNYFYSIPWPFDSVVPAVATFIKAALCFVHVISKTYFVLWHEVKINFSLLYQCTFFQIINLSF